MCALNLVQLWRMSPVPTWFLYELEFSFKNSDVQGWAIPEFWDFLMQEFRHSYCQSLVHIHSRAVNAIEDELRQCVLSPLRDCFNTCSAGAFPCH